MFPSIINQTLPPAVEGDFASANPRNSVLATEGTLVTGAAGVTVGRFAWANPSTGVTLSSGSGAPTGFVHREMQAVITAWLGASSMLIPQGMPVTLMNEGDFWVKNTVAVANIATVPRLKAFASTTDGTVQFAAAGATVAGYVETNFVLGGLSSGGTGAVGELVKITTGGKQ